MSTKRKRTTNSVKLTPKHTLMNVNSPKTPITPRTNLNVSSKSKYISPSISPKSPSSKIIKGSKINSNKMNINGNNKIETVRRTLFPINSKNLSPEQQESFVENVKIISQKNSSLIYKNAVDFKKNQKKFEDKVGKLFEKAFYIAINSIENLNTFEINFPELFTLNVFKKINRVFMSLRQSLSPVLSNRLPQKKEAQFYIEFKKNFLQTFKNAFLEEYDLIKSVQLIDSLKSLKKSISSINNDKVSGIKRQINSVNKSIEDKISSNNSPAKKKRKISHSSHKITYENIQSINSIYNSISELPENKENKSIINNSITVISLGSPKQDENILKNNGTHQLEQYFKIAFDTTLQKVFKPMYLKTIANVNIDPEINKVNNYKFFKEYLYIGSSSEFFTSCILNTIIENYVNNIHVKYDDSFYNINNFIDIIETIEKQDTLSTNTTVKKKNSKSITGGSANSIDKINDFDYLLNFADNCHDWLKGDRTNYIKHLITETPTTKFIEKFYDANKLEHCKKSNEKYSKLISSSSFELKYLTEYMYDNYLTFHQYILFLRHEYTFKKDKDKKRIAYKKEKKIKSKDDIFAESEKLSTNEADKVVQYIRNHYDFVQKKFSREDRAIYYIHDMAIVDLNLSKIKDRFSNINIEQANNFSKVWDPSPGDNMNEAGLKIDQVFYSEKNDKYSYNEIYENEMVLAKEILTINKNTKGKFNINLSFKFNKIQTSINIVSGLGVEELCLVAKFIHLYLNKNNKNDRDVVDKEFSHAISTNKVKELYNVLKIYVHNEEKNLTKEMLFKNIFKIFLDMKRTGDHGMVKVVEELNKRNTNIKDVFLISGDKLCVTKALTKKVPCLLSGYDFGTDKNDKDLNILEKIKNLIKKNKVDKILMFYKGIAIETPLYEFTIPILRHFDFTDENLSIIKKSNQTSSDDLFKKIISFILVNINNKITSDTNVLNIFNDMQSELNTLIKTGNGEILFDKSAIFYKLYIELIELLNNCDTNYYVNEYNIFFTNCTESIIALEKENKRNMEIEIEKCNKYIKDVNNEIISSKIKSIRVLNKKKEEINEKTLRMTTLMEKLEESKNNIQPEYIYNSNKDEFIKNTKFQINLVLKKFKSDDNFKSTHIVNIISFITDKVNQLDKKLIYSQNSSRKQNSIKTSTE